MNKLSKAIEKAVEETKDFGSANVQVGCKVSVLSEWESLDSDTSVDVVTIYILEDDVIKFRYQVAD